MRTVESLATESFETIQRSQKLEQPNEAHGGWWPNDEQTKQRATANPSESAGMFRRTKLEVQHSPNWVNQTSPTRELRQLNFLTNRVIDRARLLTNRWVTLCAAYAERPYLVPCIWWPPVLGTSTIATAPFAPVSRRKWHLHDLLSNVFC